MLLASVHFFIVAVKGTMEEHQQRYNELCCIVIKQMFRPKSNCIVMSSHHLFHKDFRSSPLTTRSVFVNTQRLKVFVCVQKHSENETCN